ncbi:MAG TPA: hybrid sensor histidine kinase/response regulator, partial [Polyangiaceae bacterium]|nr:hybrid sensor histidine kinase/response regulator [Polyangiaceae bacterium]
ARGEAARALLGPLERGPSGAESEVNKSLRVLIVEDSEDDAELLVIDLHRAGYDITFERVEGAEAMAAALDREPWDVVISDWTVPSFGALPALKVVQAKGLDLPFIIMSGTIGEERAVEAMRAGAHDMILKDRRARLIPAVEREVAEARRRAEQRETKERLRASEETLRKTEKLRSLGKMAAGLSHDLKNICNPLSLHLQVVRRALKRGQTTDALESVDEMDQILKRALEMLERLRDFSRQAPERKAEVVDLNHIAHEAAELAKPRMALEGRRVSVICEELGSPPPVLGHAGEIVSAVVNLVVNAIDALAEGGTITVRTGEEDGKAVVSVEDDGPGMPPDVQQRIFEPFFTTKGQEGTGLGLAMVFACMLRHGGTVTLKSAPGEGARFTLCFPAAPAE